MQITHGLMGPIAHVPHGPCTPWPMCPIGHVTYCPCGPYPCTPYPLWASLSLGPYPIGPCVSIPPVPLCPCGAHCPCAPYPLFPIAPCVHIAHRPHCPCDPYPLYPIAPLTIWPITQWGAGVMGNEAIVYRGYWVQGVLATWAMGPMGNRVHGV